MEILLAGAITALVVSLAKWLAGRIGKEFARVVIILSVFVVSLIVAAVMRYAPQEILEATVAIWLSAVGVYEVVWKTVIRPALEKAGLI